MRLALPNRAEPAGPRTGRIRRSTLEEQRAHRGVRRPNRGHLSPERPNVGLGYSRTAEVREDRWPGFGT